LPSRSVVETGVYSRDGNDKIFVRVWPSESASDVVKQLKGSTSFFLRKEFNPLLSKLPSLWTRSYFSSTAGAVRAQIIQEYIDAQKGM
jgi:putative transposase